jgi:hypothetical protein
MRDAVYYGDGVYLLAYFIFPSSSHCSYTRRHFKDTERREGMIARGRDHGESMVIFLKSNKNLRYGHKP